MDFCSRNNSNHNTSLEGTNMNIISSCQNIHQTGVKRGNYFITVIAINVDTDCKANNSCQNTPVKASR